MTKGIHFPRFLHPTSSYKAWQEVDMKWVPIDEKAYKRSNKRKRTNWLPRYAPNFTFLHFMILMSFSFEFNKGWECFKSPMETIYYLLIWAIWESSIYYLCLLSLSFFFSFLFSKPGNFCPWRSYRNFHHAHGHFPYLFPRLPFRVFNLAGFFYLNFCLGRQFEFWT